jgi:hypothetical protein
MRTVLVAVLTMLASGGCVSFDGRGLVPGSSTGPQVEAAMGAPAERLARPDGSSVLYYPRNPIGRHAYAVTVGPDGVMRSIEQRLTRANMDKLVPGTTTTKDVRELFGPPYPATVGRSPFSQREVWEYKWLEIEDKRVLWVQFSPDGILREFANSHDFGADEPTGSSMP